MNNKIIIFVFLILCVVNSITFAQSNDSISILFIGNSLTYSNQMPDLFSQIAASKGKEVEVDYSVCKPGYKLSQHWQDGAALQKIKDGDWNIVVVQEHGAIPLTDKETFHRYVRLFNEEIEKAGAEMFLYITSRSKRPDESMDYRQAPLTQAYEEIALELNAGVIPSGPAWVEVYNNSLDFELHGEDNIHPSLSGSYLTACVLYASIFNENPVGAINLLKTEVESQEIRELQQIAWNVVKNYQITPEPISAITEKGNSVILYPDGRWQKSYSWGIKQKDFINILGKPDSLSDVTTPDSEYKVLHYNENLCGITYQVNYWFPKETNELKSITYLVNPDYFIDIKKDSIIYEVISYYFENSSGFRITGNNKIPLDIREMSISEIFTKILNKDYFIVLENNENMHKIRYSVRLNQIVITIRSK